MLYERWMSKKKSKKSAIKESDLKDADLLGINL